MRHEVAQIWAKAARSGEFSQGVGYLDNQNRVCILGLLCQLAMTVGVCDVNEVKKSLYSYDANLGRLPESVQKWAKMYGRSGEIKGEFLTLAFYNDKMGWTLAELADMIEQNWEKL